MLTLHIGRHEITYIFRFSKLRNQNSENDYLALAIDEDSPPFLSSILPGLKDPLIGTKTG